MRTKLPARRPKVIAQTNYELHRCALESIRDLRGRFVYIHEVNLWGSDESHSGVGSTYSETATLRKELPTLLESLKAESVLDIPCGDFCWMSLVDLGPSVSYFGADIVPAIVARNEQRFGHPKRRFLNLDITADPLPMADVVLSRDCLVHLSYSNIGKAFANIKRSGAKWLLTTHFTELDANRDIADGDWRPLSFVLPPFIFPRPHATIIENCLEANGAFADKSLALWRVSEIPTV